MTNEAPRQRGLHRGTVDYEAMVDMYREDMRSLAADLLATRRALKMAQAAALRAIEENIHRGAFHDEWSHRRLAKACRLLSHYANLFEREAKEMGKCLRS